MARQVMIRQGRLRNTNESQNLTDGMTLCLANAYFFLKGTARMWYENNEENLSSWGKFQEQLKIAFGSTELFIKQAERELKNRAQKTGESTQTLKVRLSKCARTLP
ncbi:uncharacterized protein TNCT_566821 [Trichonephila clavata]|uniref:Retrotransposon gag domain-containing protein n=1 Tax=Trichonephila clavata TaxID=2740835 RepID=A0A8X6HAU8_TRICU|nr:uncharacterized protein TNCT_566821 [Trichonephila clavata]